MFLAVPDDAVPAVAARLAAAGEAAIPPGVSFVHLSGALGLGALQPLRARHAVGSFHPLQSFPRPRPPEAFRGIVVAVDAARPSLERRLAALARSLGARPRHVSDSQRVLYHAAAVVASNYVDVLLHEATALLAGAGWSEREARAGLLPLVEGAVDNVRERGPVAALTGPVRRGDSATVERHLEALGRLDPGSEALYRMLGEVALEIAKEAGLDPAAAERVHRALTGKTAATRRRRRR